MIDTLRRQIHHGIDHLTSLEATLAGIEDRELGPLSGARAVVEMDRINVRISKLVELLANDTHCRSEEAD